MVYSLSILYDSTICIIRFTILYFLDQYGNYKVDEVDVYLNGINTQGENIADNGGIKQAFYVISNILKIIHYLFKLVLSDYQSLAEFCTGYKKFYFRHIKIGQTRLDKKKLSRKI